MEASVTLMWFRRDLRLSDNVAFKNAKEQSNANETQLRAIYLDCDCPVWLLNSSSDDENFPRTRKQRDFARRAALNLSVKLKDFAIKMDVLSCTNELDIIKYCKAHNVGSIHWNSLNDQLTELGSERENFMRQELSKGLSVFEVLDPVLVGQCILSPGCIKTKSEDKPFTVFTPFSRAWLIKVSETLGKNLNEKRSVVSSEILDFEDYIPSEESAILRLKCFLNNHLTRYEEMRNFPAKDWHGSGLAVYQANGMISMTKCIEAVWDLPDSNGKRTWINELAWRDFYRHVWNAFPRVKNGQSFKPEADEIPWRMTVTAPSGVLKYASDGKNIIFLKDLGLHISYLDSDAIKDLKAWQSGLTGFPIIDAGMRQLHTCGTIPNRLRMLVASFLTKHLLIDWRLGERHFACHLIDHDTPSNNAGWQWSASTGTDSQPYFRIFSPYLQSSKFDPEATYIKRWVPELKESTVIDIHSIKNLPITYPRPIVDHSLARTRAINVFKNVFSRIK